MAWSETLACQTAEHQATAQAMETFSVEYLSEAALPAPNQTTLKQGHGLTDVNVSNLVVPRTRRWVRAMYCEGLTSTNNRAKASMIAKLMRTAKNQDGSPMFDETEWLNEGE